MIDGSSDPVHKAEDGKWYFWDAFWTERIGPYNTEKEAWEVCNYYGNPKSHDKEKEIQDILDFFPTKEEYEAKRHAANQKILEHLIKMVQEQPSMRLGQILEYLEVVRLESKESGVIVWSREIHTEPWVILKRIEQALKERALT